MRGLCSGTILAASASVDETVVVLVRERVWTRPASLGFWDPRHTGVCGRACVCETPSGECRSVGRSRTGVSWARGATVACCARCQMWRRLGQPCRTTCASSRPARRRQLELHITRRLLLSWSWSLTATMTSVLGGVRPKRLSVSALPLTSRRLGASCCHRSASKLRATSLGCTLCCDRRRLMEPNGTMSARSGRVRCGKAGCRSAVWRAGRTISTPRQQCRTPSTSASEATRWRK
eukprot:COSAG02_NODE_3417_length_6780_cov_54.323006_4_plen_235_part_00